MRVHLTRCTDPRSAHTNCDALGEINSNQWGQHRGPFKNPPFKVRLELEHLPPIPANHLKKKKYLLDNLIVGPSTGALSYSWDHYLTINKGMSGMCSTLSLHCASAAYAEPLTQVADLINHIKLISSLLAQPSPDGFTLWTWEAMGLDILSSAQRPDWLPPWN